jgi:hypothetical protein
MSVKILKSFVQLVILLIMFECVTPVFTVFDGKHTSHFSIASKKPSSSLLSTIAFEAEEERTKEERAKFFAGEIADLKSISTLLAGVHSPHARVVPLEHLCDSQPPLFKLHCAFLI